MHDDKKCWVCGKDDSERCSACGEAGISIFFCSRECQQFVWPIHRRFCGPGKANPFLLPTLSRDEGVAAEANRAERFPLMVEGIKHSISLEQYMATLALEGEGLSRAIQSVTSGTTRDFADPISQLVLSEIRCIEGLRIQLSHGARIHTSAVNFAVHVASSNAAVFLRRDFNFEHVGAGRPPSALPSAWYSHLLHRLVFFNYVLHGARYSVHEPTIATTMATFIGLRDCLNTVVKAAQPEWAPRMLEDAESKLRGLLGLQPEDADRMCS
ncbi:hypothetical protein JCM8097_004130 [Rhodosporidiobolus ruineniae]